MVGLRNAHDTQGHHRYTKPQTVQQR